MPTLIADEFHHAAFVLGPPQPSGATLLTSDREGSIEIDGECWLGSTTTGVRPLDALRWLSTALTENGRRLMAGDIVLTGTLMPPVPVALPARSVVLWIEGFGTLTLAGASTEERIRG